jgi:hypothetical protein
MKRLAPLPLLVCFALSLSFASLQRENNRPASPTSAEGESSNALTLSSALAGQVNESEGAVREQTSPVDYTISARLDDAGGLIRGSETIRYRNLTQDTLGVIWFHLYPNALRDRSTAYARELEAMGRFDFSLSGEGDRGRTTVDWVESGGRVTLTSEAGTELGLFLNPRVPHQSPEAVRRTRTQRSQLRAGALVSGGRGPLSRCRLAARGLPCVRSLALRVRRLPRDA